MPNKLSLSFAFDEDLMMAQANLTMNPIISFGNVSNMFEVINPSTLTLMEEMRQLARPTLE